MSYGCWVMNCECLNNVDRFGDWLELLTVDGGRLKKKLREDRGWLREVMGDGL